MVKIKIKNMFAVLVSVLLVSLVLGLISEGLYQDSSYTNKERTTIHFWNAMSGQARIALDKMIDSYNQSQNKYFVVSDYQGAYGDTLAKYLSVADTKSSPDLIQVYDIGTQVMRDSKLYTPIQSFMSAENYQKSNLEPRIQKYWNVNEQQQSMPLNTSTPVMFYNKDILEKYGFNKAPETYEDITVLGNRIKTSGDKTAAINFQIYGWLIEEMFANQGKPIINQNNGQTGIPTRSFINTDPGVKFLQWGQDMIKSGTAINSGPKEDIMVTNFLQEKAAIIMGSSANSAKLIDTAKFSVGIGNLPHPSDTERSGVTPGGASVYIAKGRSPKQCAGAWDFLKYSNSPEIQAQWSLETGYFPTNSLSYNTPTLKNALTKTPELRNAANQLQTSKDIAATSGIFSTTDTMARQIYETAMSKIYDGENVQKTLDDAATTINEELLLVKKTQGN